MDRFKRLISIIFPRPRRPVTWKSAIPLFVFLVLYAAVCIYLEWSGRLLFAQRQRFALIVITGWFWWMYVCGYAGLSRGRAMTALMTRLILVGLFVILLAEPRSVRTIDALTVVYAVDISDSVSGPKDEMTDKALAFAAQT